jgi:hypothetical protein
VCGFGCGRSAGKEQKKGSVASTPSLEHAHEGTVRVAPKKKKGMMAMKIGPITLLPAASPAAAAAAGDDAADAAGSIGRRERATAVASDNAAATAVASSAAPPAAPVASLSSRRKAVDHSAEVAGVARYEAHDGGDEAAAAEPGPSSSAEAMQMEGDGDGVVGLSRPPGAEPEAKAESSDDEDEADADDDPYRVPLSNEISLKGHKKVVAAMAVDHSGSRVVSGSYDYHCRLFDFGGMKRDLKPFRTLDAPLGDHQIVALSFSPSGHQFLAVSGSCQAKVTIRLPPLLPHLPPLPVRSYSAGDDRRRVVFGRCLACSRHTAYTHAPQRLYPHTNTRSARRIAPRSGANRYHSRGN